MPVGSAGAPILAVVQHNADVHRLLLNVHVVEVVSISCVQPSIAYMCYTGLFDI